MDVSCSICNRRFTNYKALDKHCGSDAHLQQERYQTLKKSQEKKRKWDPEASHQFQSEAGNGITSSHVQCGNEANKVKPQVIGEGEGAPHAVPPAVQQDPVGCSASLFGVQGAGQVAPPAASLHAPLLRLGAADADAGGSAELFKGMCLTGTEGDLGAAEAMAAEYLLRMSQRSTLNPHVAVIASVCLRLLGQLRDMLLKTLASKTFTPSMIPWQSAEDMASDLDSLQVEIPCMHSSIRSTLIWHSGAVTMCRAGCLHVSYVYLYLKCCFCLELVRYSDKLLLCNSEASFADRLQEFEDVVVHKERLRGGDAEEKVFTMKVRKDKAICRPLQDLLMRPQVSFSWMWTCICNACHSPSWAVLG